MDPTQLPGQEAGLLKPKPGGLRWPQPPPRPRRPLPPTQRPALPPTWRWAPRGKGAAVSSLTPGPGGAGLHL